jgi:hypothetical protein
MSHHPKALRRAGLVSSSRTGRSLNDRLDAAPLRRAQAWLQTYHGRVRSGA